MVWGPLPASPGPRSARCGPLARRPGRCPGLRSRPVGRPVRWAGRCGGLGPPPPLTRGSGGRLAYRRAVPPPSARPGGPPGGPRCGVAASGRRRARLAAVSAARVGGRGPRSPAVCGPPGVGWGPLPRSARVPRPFPPCARGPPARPYRAARLRHGPPRLLPRGARGGGHRPPEKPRAPPGHGVALGAARSRV